MIFMIFKYPISDSLMLLLEIRSPSDDVSNLPENKKVKFRKINQSITTQHWSVYTGQILCSCWTI